MNFTKKDISKEISKEIKVDLNTSSQIINAFISNIAKNLDKKIKIKNFGTFSNTITKSRIGRNPKTGEQHPIEPKLKTKFTASNNIRKIIN